MDAALVRDTLGRLLADENAALGEFEALLDREHGALSSRDIDALEALAETRQGNVIRLLKIEDERRALCSLHGYSADLSGLSKLLAWCDTAPQCARYRTAPTSRVRSRCGRPGSAARNVSIWAVDDIALAGFGQRLERVSAPCSRLSSASNSPSAAFSSASRRRGHEPVRRPCFQCFHGREQIHFETHHLVGDPLRIDMTFIARRTASTQVFAHDGQRRDVFFEGGECARGTSMLNAPAVSVLRPSDVVSRTLDTPPTDTGLPSIPLICWPSPPERLRANNGRPERFFRRNDVYSAHILSRRVFEPDQWVIRTTPSESATPSTILGIADFGRGPVPRLPRPRLRGPGPHFESVVTRGQGHFLTLCIRELASIASALSNVPAGIGRLVRRPARSSMRVT